MRLLRTLHLSQERLLITSRSLTFRGIFSTIDCTNVSQTIKNKKHNRDVEEKTADRVYAAMRHSKTC